MSSAVLAIDTSWLCIFAFSGDFPASFSQLLPLIYILESFLILNNFCHPSFSILSGLISQWVLNVLKWWNFGCRGCPVDGGLGYCVGF